MREVYRVVIEDPELVEVKRTIERTKLSLTALLTQALALRKALDETQGIFWMMIEKEYPDIEDVDSLHAKLEGDKIIIRSLSSDETDAIMSRQISDLLRRIQI